MFSIIFKALAAVTVLYFLKINWHKSHVRSAFVGFVLLSNLAVAFLFMSLYAMGKMNFIDSASSAFLNLVVGIVVFTAHLKVNEKPE